MMIDKRLVHVAVCIIISSYISLDTILRIPIKAQLLLTTAYLFKCMIMCDPA